MKPTCRVIRPTSTYEGKQGFNYFEGLASETVGSQGICMHLLTIPPGGRAKAHKHESHETAIYVISGEGGMWYGDRLEEYVVVHAGEFLYIPAAVPLDQGDRGGGPPGAGDIRFRRLARAFPGVGDRVDPGPGGFDLVAAHEQRLVAADDVEDETLIGVGRAHLEGLREAHVEGDI